MTTVKQTTMQGDWRLGALANLTNTTGVAARPATVLPPGSGGDRVVFDASGNLVHLVFLGTGTDNQTLNYTVIGWRPISSGGWAPVHLATGVATLSASITGAAGVTPGGTSDVFADELTIASGTGAAEAVAGVANILPAHLVIDPRGCRKVEVFIQRGTAASGNVLIAEL